MCIVATLVLAGCGNNSNAARSAQPGAGAIPVTVVVAMAQDVPEYGDWVATLDGYVNAQIQSQVTGYLISQDFQEGSYVHQGQVLFQIDPRPFQAALDQAKAQLAQAEARRSLAEVNVKRDTPLAQQRAVAQSQLDTELATLQEAKANVQAAQAAVETADLNLGFTKVRSLIDGIAGTATVQIGNLVGPSAVLTTVSKLDPIKVYFPISEQEYLQFVAAKSANGMQLELVLSNGTVKKNGHIVFTDRQVDPQTGTIRMVGAFPNPGNILRPGQFGRIRAVTGISKSAIVIPQRSVSELQSKYQVAVVGADNKVAIREVKLGQRIGNMWVVKEGLKPGELVIAAGVSKVHDGSLVVPTVQAADAEAHR
jgi:membrane fusion protein (multidrug efflux system)